MRKSRRHLQRPSSLPRTTFSAKRHWVLTSKHCGVSSKRGPMRRTAARGASTQSLRKPQKPAALARSRSARSEACGSVAHATHLHLLWPKQRVLEMYLNIVGIRAGDLWRRRRQRCGRSLASTLPNSHLRRLQALLASVLPLPLEWSAAAHALVAHLRHRASVIEQRVTQIRPLLTCAR